MGNTNSVTIPDYFKPEYKQVDVKKGTFIKNPANSFTGLPRCRTFYLCWDLKGETIINYFDGETYKGTINIHSYDNKKRSNIYKSSNNTFCIETTGRTYVLYNKDPKIIDEWFTLIHNILIDTCNFHHKNNKKRVTFAEQEYINEDPNDEEYYSDSYEAVVSLDGILVF